MLRNGRLRLVGLACLALHGARVAAQDPAAPAPPAEAPKDQPPAAPAPALANETPPPPTPPQAPEPQVPPPAQAPDASAHAAPPADAEPRWLDRTLGVPLTGWLSTRYRIRWTERDRDQDLYETLALDYGKPERDRVTAHFLGRVTADLDSHRDRNGLYVFDSITDTFEDRFNARLYHLYADIHRLDPLDIIRVGRQTNYETPVVAYFDGARVETEDLGALRFRAGAYGGVPVHLFESSRGGDAEAGAFVQARPWQAGRLRIDWMHAEDKSALGTQSNNLWGFGFWQGLGDYIELHTLYTRLEDSSRDLLVRGTFQQPAWDLRFQASYYGLLQTQRDLSLEFDPFYAAALDYHPYHQFRLVGSKGFGEHVAVDAGTDIRWLRRAWDEGAFNREFERYFITPSLRDLPWEGLTLSLTGEVWDSRGRDILTLGADLTQKCTDAFKFSVGSAYALYKYDYYLNRERDNVRTYYLKAVYKLGKDLRFEAGYEFEDDSFEDYQVFKSGVTWSF